MASHRRITRRSLVLLAGALLLGGLLRAFGIETPDAAVDPRVIPREATRQNARPDAAERGPARLDTGVARIARAHAARESGFMVTVEGEVERVLADDRDGSRHQRLLVRLADGRTLLVAHNIDLADRVPVEKGDRLRLRGQYEWNERGGVLHWTHHDPDGSHPGGWIEHAGRRFE